MKAVLLFRVVCNILTGPANASHVYINVWMDVCVCRDFVLFYLESSYFLFLM